MPVYLLTGRLGSGKSLAATGRAEEYLAQGRRVVSNYWLDIAPRARPGSKLACAVVEVIPDRPTADVLWALGRGGPSEERAGLLLLDECATWLNSRAWNAQERQKLIDWFLHSRKLKWDVILICQHQSALDKQVREMICEYLVTCRRLDRFKFLGIKLPRVHVASVRYGLSPTDLNAEHWVYRGVGLYACYDTSWQSREDPDVGWHSVLPAWHTRYRDHKPRSVVEQLAVLPGPLYLLLVPVLGVLSLLSAVVREVLPSQRSAVGRSVPGRLRRALLRRFVPSTFPFGMWVASEGSRVAAAPGARSAPPYP